MCPNESEIRYPWQHEVKYCWPTTWLEAAEKANLAVKASDGKYVFHDIGGLPDLQEFAERIYQLGHSDGVEKAQQEAQERERQRVVVKKK